MNKTLWEIEIEGKIKGNDYPFYCTFYDISENITESITKAMTQATGIYAAQVYNLKVKSVKSIAHDYVENGTYKHLI